MRVADARDPRCVGAPFKPMADLRPDGTSAAPVLFVAVFPRLPCDYQDDTHAARYSLGQRAFKPLMRCHQGVAVEIDGHFRLKPAAGEAPFPTAIQNIRRPKTPPGARLLLTRAC